MKVVQINTSCGIGSTGKICVDISKLLTQNNCENYILYSTNSSGYRLGIRCSTKMQVYFQALKSKLLGNYGFNSSRATKKMISELMRIKPDIVHLHNIHGHDCNLEMLFAYFRKESIKVVWTFHDCWAFTGYCPHFMMAKCDKWVNGCYSPCIQKREFSCVFDRSRTLYEKKKSLFEEIDIAIVTPSEWLANIVKQTYLKNHPVFVINNGIDLSIFRDLNSDFRERYNLDNKKIILGVAFDWGIRKGIDVFNDLADRLTDDYQIVLVGTNKTIDGTINSKILTIHRTNSQKELAEIYSAADVFVNPTREDNYPTVNMESLACGTPVITFDTGGSSEMIDANCGAVVACDDIESLRKAIIFTCENKPYSAEQCCSKASSFDKNKKYQEYVDLYERIITSGNERN